MKVLFIGDIVGKSGRDIVSSLLYSLKKDNNIDLVIANAENSAHGKGITYRIYNQLINEGIDYITMGNHTYSKSEINEHMDEMDRLIVPINHVKRNTDNYYKIISFKGIKFCLTNILGVAFMNETQINQYDSFKQVLEKTKNDNIDFYFVDFHAEATAEKRIFAEYFKDYAKVVLGTHTHVQTADEQILPNGTAYITDAGMCGAYVSVLGVKSESVIRRFTTSMPTRFDNADGKAEINGVIVDIDENSKKATKITRLYKII